jgi:prophage DNA circulation protein
MALLQGGILPASYRGAPFAVFTSDVGGGRRVALHQYPGRDDPWAEDMGRAARHWRFRGFIVDGDVVFAGGPIQLQRALLLAVLESSGPGLLIHPTLGAVQAVVIGFTLGEGTDASRYSTLEVEFLESGKQQYPSLLTSSQGLLSSSNLCIAALAADGVRAIALAASSGDRREALATTANLWANDVVALSGDATAMTGLASQLPGNFGRYATGGNSGVSGAQRTAYSSSTMLSDLVEVAAVQRAIVSGCAIEVQSAIATTNLGYAPDVAASVVALVAALTAACADPADALRLLESLIAFQADWPAASVGISVGFSAMMRRAACVSLAAAAAQYQPTSSDDAAAKISQIGAIIGNEAEIAANAGENESFRALRALRGVVVDDLRSRGATLPQVKLFSPGESVPSLALAQRYYRDASRADQLVVQAQPVHPLFMPASYSALAA